jgi:hypothetical protein
MNKHSTTKLVIANTSIHQDADGRFSLNDLHRASGGNPVHAPGQFLRNQQTIDLIAAIDSESDVQISASVATKKGGHNQGSYGAKELVYAYAMWISPKFHLQVIRTFDALVTGDIEKAQQIAHSRQPLPARLFPDYFKVAKLIGCDINTAAISANNAVFQKTGENVLKLLGHTHLEAENQEALFFTPTELGERMNISGRKFNMLLAEAGLQAKKGEHWVPLTTAEGFCRIMDTGKRHGDGTMIQQVKWADNVLALVEKAAA